MLEAVGSVLGAAGSYFGGKSSSKAQAKQQALDRQANINMYYQSRQDQLDQYADQRSLMLEDREYQRRFTESQDWFNRDMQLNRLQRTAEDAKLAGIHPLFAMGSSGGYGGGVSYPGGGSFIPGQPASGSTISSAVTEQGPSALSAIGDAISGVARSQQGAEARQSAEAMDALNAMLIGEQIKETRSRTDANSAQAHLFNSEAARNAQSILNVRSSPNPGSEEFPSSSPRSVNLYGLGKVGPGKGYGTAQEAQDIVGDPGEWWQALNILTRSAWSNAAEWFYSLPIGKRTKAGQKEATRKSEALLNSVGARPTR